MSIINKYSHQIQTLKHFKKKFVAYYHLQKESELSKHQKTQLDHLRKEINLLTGEVTKYIVDAGVPTVIQYSRIKNRQGMQGPLSLFSNINQIHELDLPKEIITDPIEKAIGNYNLSQIEHIKYIRNPINWVRFIIQMPFLLLKFAGFNANKAETSIFGKLYKLIASIIVGTSLILAIVASAAQILDYMGIPFIDLKDKINHIRKTVPPM